MVWDAEWRRTLKSGRAAVLLGLYGLFSLIVLLVVGALAQAVQRSFEQQGIANGADPLALRAAYEQMNQGVLGFLVSDDPAMIDALGGVPLVVLIVFKVTLFFLPAYVALMGFDQVSGEVGPRSIRFHTVRAQRISLLLGKFFSQATVLIGLVLVVDLGLFLYAKLSDPLFGWGLLVISLGKFWLAAAVFSLAYLALSTFCSTLFRSPALSLVFNFVVLFVFWLLELLGEYQHRARMALVDAGVRPLELLRFVSPSHYATHLLHPGAVPFLSSVAAYLAFALIFLAGAYAVLQRRDL